MQVLQSLQHSQTDILAKLFTVITIYFFKHGGQCATIHQFKEDPETALEIKAFEAT
jgi:hypothetical protein